MFKIYVVYSWGLKKIVIIFKNLFELLLHIGIFLLKKLSLVFLLQTFVKLCFRCFYLFKMYGLWLCVLLFFLASILFWTIINFEVTIVF